MKAARSAFATPVRARARKTMTILTTALAAATPAWAWEPSKPVEFVVPAGTGGGADQMARLIQGIIVKHKLMKESLVVINKSGGAGAEGFLDIKELQGQPAQDRHHACRTCSRRRWPPACPSTGRT